MPKAEIVRQAVERGHYDWLEARRKGDRKTAWREHAALHAYAAGRAAGREEAAKVADDAQAHRAKDNIYLASGWNAAGEIASAIRALKGEG